MTYSIPRSANRTHLKKVTDITSKIFVLHIEFQTEDEPDMVYRMAEYKVMLMREYRLEVKQYVIYLRDNTPTMPIHLAQERFTFSFQLVRLASVNYKLFLKSHQPEIKMLGILGNFGQDSEYAAIKSIVEGIRISAGSDFADSRYFNQLRIFVQLRNSIQPQFEQIMDTVTKFFKEENDFLYRRGESIGIEKGIEKKNYEVVKNLIEKMGLTDPQVADIAAVPLAYVKKIRESLGK